MKKRANKNGYTLVELIVTFALTAMLMGTVAALIPAYMDIYARTEEVAGAQHLAKTLSETMLAELATAQKSYIDAGGAPNICVLISGGDATGQFNRIKYRNKSGYLVEMYADAEGRLMLHYFSIVNESGVGQSPDVYWGYEDGIYGGSRLTRLWFSEVGDGLIKVEFTLRDEGTGYEYPAEDIIKCYNLPLPGDIETQ